MPSLADVFVQVAGNFTQLRQQATQQGGQAGTAAGRTFGDKFKAGLQVAGAAAGVLLIAGVVKGMQQQGSASLLAAQVGAAGPDVARLGRVAGNLYAENFGGSIEEVNNALRALIQNGLAGVNTAEADLQRLGAQATTLTTLLGEDANRVAAAVQQMLRTGLAKTAEEAFDILTKATQGGINKSEDLLDTINEYSTQFRQLGLDGPAALGLISQALQAGARDSDTVADALKEFAIRAQDGSKLSADALRALGLDAKTTFDAIAAGGPTSAAALDSVLDKLRAMPPSAERTALAVALFGTKAEDLQQALFAMDLSGATQQFGDFRGATQEAADTMGGSASAAVETFKRQVEQGLVNALAGAIPHLQSLWGWVVRNKDIIGPTVAVIAAFAAVVWTVNAAVTAWAAVTAAANAVHLVQAARMVYLNLVTGLWLAKIYLVRAATIAWTAIQWALNAAFVANPIGIIIAVIAALVAAVVIAYKNSETFRNIVQATWAGIKAAAVATWEGFLKPIFVAIGWYIENVVVPWFLFLYRNVVKPTWEGIQLAIQIAWTLIQVWWGAMTLYVQKVLAPLFLWLYNNIIKPVWGLIVAYIEFAWGVIKAIFSAIGAFITGIFVPYWQWIWDRIKVIWTGIKDTISAVWTNFIQPVLRAVGDFITNTVVPAFQRGVDAIGTAWDKIKELSRKPVAFVVNTVINPLVRGYNAIATKFGGNKVDEIQGFAAGGFFDGRLPGAPSDVDNMLARGPGGRTLALASGEFVTNARSTAKHLPLLRAINADRFADGGIIDWILHPIETAKRLIGGPLNRLSEIGNTPFGQWISQMPRRLFDSFVSAIKNLVTAESGGGFAAGGGSLGGSAGMMRLLRAVFPGLSLLSGFRPGSRTLSGALSWHARDRAVDVPPIYAVAQWIHDVFGSRALELITPWQSLNLLRGRPHTYSGAVWRQHNFSGGNAHIHWAARLGGLLGLGRVGVYDGGGAWPSGTFGYNGSGRTEQVTPAATMDRVAELLAGVREDLAVVANAITRVAPELGDELRGVSRGMLQIARAR